VCLGSGKCVIRGKEIQLSVCNGLWENQDTYFWKRVMCVMGFGKTRILHVDKSKSEQEINSGTWKNDSQEFSNDSQNEMRRCAAVIITDFGRPWELSG
jgi:hypothetical protein